MDVTHRPQGGALTSGATPIRVGLLFDYPQGDHGAYIDQALRLGIEAVATGHDRLDREVETVVREVRGLPLGSEHELLAGVDELDAEGVLAIVGPTISDNCLLVRDEVERRAIPAINYSGGERTRGPWMFHYQVGSLEEEPLVLADHITRRGWTSVGVLYDRSPVGRRYAEVLEARLSRDDVEVATSAGISALSDDLTDAVRRLQAAAPEVVVYLGLGVAAKATADALHALGWDVPVIANSALMFGYSRRDWRADFEGWVYVDTVADGNAERERLRRMSKAYAASPIGCAAYDIGRLLGLALSRTEHLTRHGVRQALEGVKWLQAASGHDGTQMGFGVWDHAALKGPYLVLRRWRDGRSVQVS